MNKPATKIKKSQKTTEETRDKKRSQIWSWTLCQHLHGQQFEDIEDNGFYFSGFNHF